MNGSVSLLLQKIMRDSISKSVFHQSCFFKRGLDMNDIYANFLNPFLSLLNFLQHCFYFFCVYIIVFLALHYVVS